MTQVNDLSEFRTAKVHSIKIFQNLCDLIKSSIIIDSKFQECYSSNVSSDNTVFLESSLEKSNRIIHILERNQMKCAFFGRTSNGKSSVINAILGQRILPCGIGHTTNCFLQIQGTTDINGFILKNKPYDPKRNNCKMDTLSSNENLPIPSVLELGHALSAEKASSNTVIKLYWPQTNCEMLKNDIALLDSPGIDIDPDMDYWIDQNCMDADVFVLVVNSESTITQTEKDFFHKVREKISKPNIFILNNRWDICDREDNIAETRQQHQRRCITFLTTELSVCSNAVAKDRIYFISAKEVLQSRTHESSDTEIVNFQERNNNFIKFEKSLEKTLCQSALVTKFSAHILQGLELTDKILLILKSINEQLSTILQSVTETKVVRNNQVKNLKTNVVRTNTSVNKYINDVLENIRFKVEESIKLEIQHLNAIVNDFSAPFNVDSGHLLIYKTELNNFVENEMDIRLSSLCSNVVKAEVSKFKNSLLHEYSGLLEIEIDKSLISSIEKISDHELNIPCNSLFSDFKEDLSFQWPLSPHSLLINFLTLSSLARAQIVSNYVPPENQTRLETFRPIFSQFHEILMNKEFLGFCLVTAVISKATGTSIVVSSVCSYSLLYVFERFRWKSSTREANFKKQYVKYALKQLTNIVDISARSYSSVIKQELQMNHKSLARFTDNEIARIETEVIKMDADIQDIGDHRQSIAVLKSNADAIKNDLNNFKSSYL